MSVFVSRTTTEPRFGPPENNRFYKCATIIIENHGHIPVRELAQRARVSEESSYQAILAFRGIIAALDDAQMLARNVEFAVVVEEKKPKADDDDGQWLTLEQAKQVLKGETQLG